MTVVTCLYLSQAKKKKVHKAISTWFYTKKRLLFIVSQSVSQQIQSDLLCILKVVSGHQAYFRSFQTFFAAIRVSASWYCGRFIWSLDIKRVNGTRFTSIISRDNSNLSSVTSTTETIIPCSAWVVSAISLRIFETSMPCSQTSIDSKTLPKRHSFIWSGNYCHRVMNRKAKSDVAPENRLASVIF